MTSSAFVNDARTSAGVNGMPPIRVVTVTETKWRPSTDAKSKEEMVPLATEALDGVIKALTTPLTAEEQKPAPIKVAVESTVTVSGEDYPTAAESMYQFFMGNRWTDGLPVMPPTLARVKWMLTGTSRSPSDVIGEVAPAKGKATVEKIAINALMAGAKPEYLPVVITAMEVLTDPGFDLTHLQNSLGGLSPIVIVDGPIAQELGMNSEQGMFGFGWRQNSAIGRAVRLNMINLGHSWPGVNRMGGTGSPAEFTSWCFAEHTQNPWQPLAADLGAKPTDSAVSIFGVEQWGPVRPPSASSNDAEAIMGALARGMEQSFKLQSYHFASYGHAYQLVLIGPTEAANLAKAGLSKTQVRQWLFDHARVPYSTFAAADRLRLKENISQGRIPKTWDTTDENAMLPVVINVDNIWLAVAGAQTGVSLIFHAVRAERGSKVIRGATLTNAGR